MDGSGFCWTLFGMNLSHDQKLTIMLLKEHETFKLDGNSPSELELFYFDTCWKPSPSRWVV